MDIEKFKTENKNVDNRLKKFFIKLRVNNSKTGRLKT